MTERRFYPPTENDIPMHGWSPYADIHRERIRAHAKHDGDNGGSMERRTYADSIWLPVLTEEVGEVARLICDGAIEGGLDRVKLREELVQVAAMAVAWIEAVDHTSGGSR